MMKKANNATLTSADAPMTPAKGRAKGGARDNGSAIEALPQKRLQKLLLRECNNFRHPIGHSEIQGAHQYGEEDRRLAPSGPRKNEISSCENSTPKTDSGQAISAVIPTAER